MAGTRRQEEPFGTTSRLPGSAAILIVGEGAALTAIAVYLAIIAVKSLRASWRARRTERLIAHHDSAHDALRPRERAGAQFSR